jgi:hypothetical protein
MYEKSAPGFRSEGEGCMKDTFVGAFVYVPQ